MHKYDKPLTEREYEIASVASDLLLKGDPFTRIIKHCIDRGLTKDQTIVFFGKLESQFAIDFDFPMSVSTHYDGMKTQQQDASQRSGAALRAQLNQTKK